MQLSAVGLHPHPIAKSEVRDAVHSRHERWAARVHSDERIRTERLNAAHLGRSDALVGGNEAYVLGAYAEVDLAFVALERHGNRPGDRKSTRLNSSHSQISYAAFCLKKKSSGLLASEPETA